MNKPDFISKANDLLSDRSTYYPIRINPLRNISGKASAYCAKLLDAECITKTKKYQILSHAYRLPQITFLPKIHKENIPFRPLVDGTGSHLHYLAKYLFEQLKYIPRPSSIKNSFDFATKINDLEIPPNHVMVSFDVVSLFTSVPVQLSLDTVSSIWPELAPLTFLSKTLLLEGLRLVLHNSYIQANNLDGSNSIF